MYRTGCNKKFLRSLADKIPNYERLLVDLPGHGDDKSTDYSYKNYINTLVDFIREFKDRKVAVIGHSLGAALTIDIASRNLDNVIAAVSLSGGATFPDLDKEAFMKSIHEGKFNPEDLIPYSDVQYPEVIEALGTVDSGDIFIKDLLLDLKIDINSQIDNIKTPLFLLVGGDDGLVKYEYSHEVYLKARDYATLLAIPGFKHMLCIAYKDVLAPLIENYIELHDKN